MNIPHRVLIVAGGTGGHIAPALAVGDHLRRAHGERVHVRYLTGSRSTEKQVFEAAEEFPDVLACDRAPSLSLGGMVRTIRYGRSVLESRALLRRFQPDAILATGGYVCAPVLLAARMAGVPYFLHESNAVPGKVTRAFAKNADCVFVAHEGAAEWLDAGCRASLTGTPVRSELLVTSRQKGAKTFTIDAGVPTILVLGGSQGARGLNDALCDALADLAYRDSIDRLNVIWACGPLNLKSVTARVDKIVRREVHIKLFDYIGDVHNAYACADLVVSRAGASTLAEITALGLPSILVPYPHATDNHQYENARALEDAGAAVLMPETTLTGAVLADEIELLLVDHERREDMAGNSARLGSPACLDVIAEHVMSNAGGPHPQASTTPGKAAA